jgi:hypothetical protein
VQLYRRFFTKHGLPFLFVSGCRSDCLALKDAIEAILDRYLVN